MKLIPWNIQWGRGADGRVDLDRIVAHPQQFADFDVLCVQEVSAGHHQLPGCDGSNQFEQLAVRLPGYEPVAGVASDVFGAASHRRRFGNMLFSRSPVRQVFRHLLPWPAEDGVLGRRDARRPARGDGEGKRQRLFWLAVRGLPFMTSSGA